jgi:LPXTG-motif cell wall-anchored protein
MSTVTRESIRNSLPQTGRGDAIFAVVALLVCLLALVLKVSGIA